MGSLSIIAVIGATGTAGSRVVARLKARDVGVVEVCRAHGVDVISGRGLFEALAGVDVVIDVSNPLPADGQSNVTQTVAAATRNIVGACAARHVGRLVVLTIAGIEEPSFDGFPYYEAKRAAKEIVLAGPVPATLVKSTQWYEFATNPAAVSSVDGEVVVQDWLIQPVAADTVADVLVETALGQTHPPRTITGPEVVRLPELTSKLLAQRGTPVGCAPCSRRSVRSGPGRCWRPTGPSSSDPTWTPGCRPCRPTARTASRPGTAAIRCRSRGRGIFPTPVVRPGRETNTSSPGQGHGCVTIGVTID